MTAMLSTPRLELLHCLIAADLEMDRLRGQLRGLHRRLTEARRDMAGAAARTPLESVYLWRIEGEYEEVLVQLGAARREAQALGRVD